MSSKMYYVTSLSVMIIRQRPLTYRQIRGLRVKDACFAHLAGVVILADPSHRRRTVSNRLYALAGKRKCECALTKEQAGQLVNYFGHWQAQLKTKTLAEIHKSCRCVVLHASGDHSTCLSWCNTKRAEKEGLKWLKTPLLDPSTEEGKKTIG